MNYSSNTSALIFDISSAWDYAKASYGIIASQTDWLSAMDSESIEQLKEMHRDSPKDWSLNKLAFSLIK
tara:strand:- start:343 stop:549 length:207 start_codon:yes stop_codon:yes gene_type:complete